MRENRQIYTTTIAELLSYSEAIGQLNYSVIDSKTVTLTNRGNKTIKGLSLAVSADNVEINGITPEMKKSGKDTIFWFSIEPEEEVLISFW
jgi:hypothetical protein